MKGIVDLLLLLIQIGIQLLDFIRLYVALQGYGNLILMVLFLLVRMACSIFLCQVTRCVI